MMIQRLIQRLVLAVPLAIAWMLLTGLFSIESFGVGLLISFLLLSMLFPTLKWRSLKEWRLPGRIIAAVQYTLILFRDIYLSAMDVARRIIDPELPMNPGIIRVETGYTPLADEQDAGDLVAAISAHGITITPGELVVSFEGNSQMYVHCLDVEASSMVAVANQARRVALLRKIFS